MAYTDMNLYQRIANIASIDPMSYDSQIVEAIEKALDLAVQGFSIAPEDEGMRAVAIRDFLQNAHRHIRKGDKRRAFQELKNVVVNAKAMSKLLSGKTAADPSKVAVKAWMRKHVADYADPKTGEVNMTSLAEDAAGEFDKKDLGGWLDDETHWVWDAAQEVADSYEKTSKKATSPEQWEKGAELIEGGASGKFRKLLDPKLDDIDAAFRDAAKTLENHKRLGVGRTESPALLLGPLRRMQDLSKFLDKLIKRALADTGAHESDL